MKRIKKSQTAAKALKAKATKRIAPQQTSAAKARAQGIRLFKLAGRPTEEQFVLENSAATLSPSRILRCGVHLAAFCADFSFFPDS